MNRDICRRLALDHGTHAAGLISEHDFERCNAGLAGALDRAHDQRPAENELQELRLARRIPKSIAIAGGEYERRLHALVRTGASASRRRPAFRRSIVETAKHAGFLAGWTRQAEYHMEAPCRGAVCGPAA